MNWGVFWAVIAANVLTSIVIAAVTWISEKITAKHSDQETEDDIRSENEKLHLNVIKTMKDYSEDSGKESNSSGPVISNEEWCDWIADFKYLERGYYDYAAECHDIFDDLREKLLEVKEYNPVEEYAPGGNLGPVEPEDIEGIIAETEILTVIMKHHNATPLDLAKVCKYYQVLMVADQYELDWKQAAKDYGIDFLTKKYFKEACG